MVADQLLRRICVCISFGHCTIHLRLLLGREGRIFPTATWGRVVGGFHLREYLLMFSILVRRQFLRLFNLLLHRLAFDIQALGLRLGELVHIPATRTRDKRTHLIAFTE